MKFDIASHLGAVTRVVASSTRDARPAHTVIVMCNYRTDIDDVWDALTNIERIPRWLMPISGDLRLGGRYQLEGNAGGEITKCEPPKLLAVTWEYGGAVSWVTVTITPVQDGVSRLTVEYVQVDEDHWRRFGPGAVGVGWDLWLLALARHLATGEVVDNKESVAWLSKPEGKQFVRHSSADWCRADIDGGEVPETAKASAERTRAGYTGEAAPSTEV